MADGPVETALAQHVGPGAAAAFTAKVSPQAGQSTDAPQRVSEVKAWLSAHGGVDPGVLAPYDDQKATARTAAIRALGKIATPQALEVLGQYASDSYPDKVLDELHKAWGRFDRRVFAATPGTATYDVVVALVRKGVRVVVYKHETEWVTGLRERAEQETDVFLAEAHGRIGLVDDESELDPFERSLGVFLA